MADILKFAVPGTTFDPKTTSMLGSIFDEAMSHLEAEGGQDLVKEVIAGRIIALASKGERDPDRLRSAAFSAFGLLNGIGKDRSAN